MTTAPFKTSFMRKTGKVLVSKAFSKSVLIGALGVGIGTGIYLDKKEKREKKGREETVSITAAAERDTLQRKVSNVIFTSQKIAVLSQEAPEAQKAELGVLKERFPALQEDAAVSLMHARHLSGADFTALSKKMTGSLSLPKDYPKNLLENTPLHLDVCQQKVMGTPGFVPSLKTAQDISACVENVKEYGNLHISFGVLGLVILGMFSIAFLPGRGEILLRRADEIEKDAAEKEAERARLQKEKEEAAVQAAVTLKGAVRTRQKLTIARPETPKI